MDSYGAKLACTSKGQLTFPSTRPVLLPSIVHRPMRRANQANFTRNERNVFANQAYIDSRLRLVNKQGYQFYTLQHFLSPETSAVRPRTRTRTCVASPVLLIPVL